MKDKIQEIIKSLINFTEYEESPDDVKCIQIEGLEKYIFRKLSSTKFRKKSVSKNLKRKIVSAIKLSVNSNRPIHISVPFGGYKKWQYDTAPHIDWAEVFNILHLRNYVASIIKLYEPGVIIEYFSDEIFVERMNKISQLDLDIFNTEFANLCEYITKKSPGNLKIKLSKIRDSINSEELHKRFDKELEIQRINWDLLDDGVRAQRIRKAERNFKPDLSDFTTKKKLELLKNSTLIHDTFIFGDWEEGVSWAFEPDMIPVGFRYTGEWGIALSSAPGSAVQFWVGIGVLKFDEIDNLHTRILTYEQYLKVREKLKYESVDLDRIFPRTIPVLSA